MSYRSPSATNPRDDRHQHHFGRASLRRCTAIISVAAGISLSSGFLDQPSRAGEIDDYIRSLDYDPRTLLSLPETNSTEAIPVKKKRDDRNAVVICTSENVGLNKNLDNITILNPLSGVVYPGALIRANRRLAEGTPEAVSLPRGPITISVDLPGLLDKKKIEKPQLLRVSVGTQ